MKNQTIVGVGRVVAIAVAVVFGVLGVVVGVVALLRGLLRSKKLSTPSGQIPAAAPEAAAAPRGLRRPPGQKLRRFAQFVFSKRFYTGTLEPTLSDLELEYFEALSEGRTAKARWVHIRGVISFWAAIGAQIPVSLVKLVKLSWK